LLLLLLLWWPLLSVLHQVMQLLLLCLCECHISCCKSVPEWRMLWRHPEVSDVLQTHETP
jgi:hypothetical protein